MTMDQYRGIVERLDIGQKVKRLELELNGDAQTGAPGLRAAFFATYRDVLAQQRLVNVRSAMKLPPAQQALADADNERAMYQLASLRTTLDYIAESIAATEAELEAASKIGSGEISLEEPGQGSEKAKEEIA